MRIISIDNSNKDISFEINKISLINFEHIDSIVEKDISSILTEINVEQKDLNEEVVRALLKFWQPVSKDKIDYINYISKIVENIKRNNFETLVSMLLSDVNILDSPIDVLNRTSLITGIGNILDFDKLHPNINFHDNDGKEDINSLMKSISENLSLDKDSLDSFECLFYRAYKALYSINKTDLEAIIYLLSKDIEITTQNLYIFNKLIYREKGLTDYLVNIINTLCNYDDEELKHFNEELLRIFIDIRDIKNSPINEQIIKMTNILRQLDNAVERKGIKDYELVDNMHNLKSSIDFIKSINQHINYYHIPITINHQNTFVEVYIYKDGKRNNKIDLSNVNILISMDLENIGHIESLIHIGYKKINITFKTENRIIADIIYQNSKELKCKLESKGYYINIFLEEQKDKFDLIELEDKLNNGEITRHSIDVRL